MKKVGVARKRSEREDLRGLSRMLPVALDELEELRIGARDENDELTLSLASPAHGMETGVTKGKEETSILIFCLLCVESCLLLCEMNGTGFEDDDEVDITHGERVLAVGACDDDER